MRGIYDLQSVRKFGPENSASGAKREKSRRFFRHGRMLITLLLLLSFFHFFSVKADAAYDSSRRETVRVGFFAMDGYHMMDEDGNRSGYGWDVLRLMARYWDVRYEYIGYEDSWEDMQKMLEDGEIDMVSSARKTPEREEKFDFSRPIGTNMAVMTVRSDNDSIIAQDYTTYDGIRIALLRGNSRNDDLAKFAKEHDFTYQPVFFDGTKEMEEALQNGTVDAIVTSSLRQTRKERVIEKFDSSEFYIMVKKGNTELLDQINYALDQLNAAEGDWKTELNHRYYENYGDRNLEYTEEEKKVIEEYNAAEEPLLVLCDPTRYPYSYVEDGEVKGILPDYFREVAEYAGLSYQFIVCKDRDEYLAYQTDGNVGLCIDTRVPDDNLPESRDLGMTASYITMRLAMVTRRNFDGKIHVIATVNQNMSGNLEDSYAKDADRLVCENREDAMKAVADGRADAAFVYYYTAQAYVNSDQGSMLAYTLFEEPTFQYHIMVNSGRNHALAGILTKAIYAMPDNLIEEIASGYTSYKATDVTFLTLVRLYPAAFVLGAVALVLLLVALAVLITRIHARKKMQDAIQQKADEMKALAEKAEAANKTKSLFLSNMSHDIRTPLNGIIGLLKIDEAHMENQDLVRENHEKMEVAADHLLSLVNDVLQMSRLEDGTAELAHETLDVKETLENTGTIISEQAAEAGITMKYGDFEITVPYVYGSPLHLRQIFLNIYGNCIKYNKVGGSVTTSMQCMGVRDGIVTYRWIILDTGIGMEPEFLQHIFEPFVQEKKNARSVYQGTGLGMAIVKGLVEQMGGTISVTSKKDEGSTFVLTIPFEIAKEPSEKKKETGEDIHGLHLLLAEDNELNAEIAQTLLTDQGAVVTLAKDGEQAVELFRDHPAGTYDAILMDIMMPVMDGLTATRTIRAIDRPDAGEIPIIAMTANAFAEDAQKCLNAGMNAHLAKPLDIQKMITVIAKLTRKKTG